MVGESETKSLTPPDATGGVLVAPATPVAFQLCGVVLLSSDGSEPLQVAGITLTFAHEGVRVSLPLNQQPQLLPWLSLTAHVVESWNGSVAPEWWIDPELNPTGEGVGEKGEIIDPAAINRTLPHTEAGALISLRTLNATYRFLWPGGNAGELAPKVAAFTYSHHGPAGASSATTVVASRSWDKSVRHAPGGTVGLTWIQIRPVAAALLIVCMLTAAILIVLQSAGVIHISILGGVNAGMVGPVRIR